MTPVRRSLAGDVLAFDLGQEMQLVGDELVAGRARSSRTLVSSSPGAMFLLSLSAKAV